MYRDKSVPSPVPSLSRLAGLRLPATARVGLVLESLPATCGRYLDETRRSRHRETVPGRQSEFDLGSRYPNRVSPAGEAGSSDSVTV